jgi:hypothetical protein
VGLFNLDQVSTFYFVLKEEQEQGQTAGSGAFCADYHTRK